MDRAVLLTDCAVPTPAVVNLSSTAKYQFIDLVTTGIIPGGDRWLGMLRRNT